MPEQRAEHIAALKRLPSEIPDIESLSVGADMMHLNRSFDTGLVGVFANRAALDHYSKHPEHLKVVELGKDITETIISVDFEN
jgi:hypothetical protein